MAKPMATTDYDVDVLGPLTVLKGGTELDLGGPKQRLTLAVLIADIDHVVSTDGLIERIWGADPPPTARKAVQVHVSNLRRILGDAFPLRTAPGGYMVQSADLCVDVVSFERELAAAKATLRTDPLGTERVLTDAIARWRGPAYADLADESALVPEITRLTELRLQALEVRVDGHLRVGRHTDVVGELATLCTEHPYRERFRELHMLALYRSGRQTEALRAYQRTRSELVDELGINPGPSLQALHQQILEQATELDLEDTSAEDRFAFVATDIEDSTAMWEAEPEAMQRAVARHDEILADAVASNAGTVFKGTGDGIFAVFAAAADALQTAVDAQQALHAEQWSTAQPVLVRIGVDEGPASVRGGDYFGPALNRVSRLMSSGHGGQVLCPAELALRSPVPIRQLGSADYRGVGRLDVDQLVIPGVPDEFPNLQTDRAPRTTMREGFGRAIRGYELRERLGEGAHGVVYRAYQAAIGREVAIKVIRPEHANRAEFVKRFEAEAQFVAQLEHPHIVSLYDYWRDPDGAYLVMQVLRGGSLATSLARAPWRPPAALQLLDQVGAALDYAHRQGVIHRDLKPANVLLDGEGNAYLSDFGIASHHVEAVGVPVGSSVAYVSPEELAGEEVGLAADMYGLALLTYEILVGDRPALGEQPAPIADRRQDLPPSLDQVLARATDRDPTKRFDRVDDFLRSLRQSFGADVVTHQRRAGSAEVRNPYKGLRAFAETDAHDYFGRDQLVRELVDHVSTHRLTAVVGPSGSGKSSLVRAGLLPQIRRMSATGPGAVLVTDMFPGSYPFEELEAALLRVAVDRQDGLLGELLADDRGLLRMSKQLLPDDESELLLVIDQFEELFLLTQDDDARRRFLASLVTVAGDERSRVRIVITMRADHFDRPLVDPEFGALLRTSLVPIAMPSHDELTQAIAQPAAAAGLEFEAGLIPRIVHDVADEPGALPLLQYALTELVRSSDDAALTFAGYERTGGVAGALTLRAEEIYEGLPAASREAAREVFLRLVAVDETGDDTRRRVRRSELDSLGLGEAALDTVLDAYGSFRLLSFDRDPVTRGPTVEVAHEALIRQWPRYRTWVDERREDLLLERRLETAATEWDASEREHSFLFGGGQLDQYEQWANSTDVRLTETEHGFLHESRVVSDTATAAGRRRRRGVLSAVALLAALATLAAVVAVFQRNDATDSAAEAERQRQTAEELAQLEAESRVAAEQARDDAELARDEAAALGDEALDAAELERQARESAVIQQQILRSANLRADAPTLALLLAREVYDRAPGPDTLGALLSTLQRTDGYLGTIPLRTGWANDQWLGLLDDQTAVVRTTNSIDVYDLERRELVKSTPASSNSPSWGTYVDGSVAAGRFATATGSGGVMTVEPGSSEAVVLPVAGEVTTVEVGLDGSLLLGFADGRVEVQTSTETIRLGRHPVRVTSAAINGDATLAATQDAQGSTTVWDVETASAKQTRTRSDPERWRTDVEPLEPLPGILFGLVDGGPPTEPAIETLPQLENVVSELRFSEDGTVLYVLSIALTASNADNGLPLWEMETSGFLRQVTELNDGGLIVGNQLIDNGLVSAELDGLSPLARVVATEDESMLVALDADGLSLWSLDGDQLIAQGIERAGANVATLSTDGAQLAAFHLERSFASSGVVWDMERRTSIQQDQVGSNWIFFNSSSDLIAFSSLDRTIEIADPRTLTPMTPDLFAQTWASIEVSPDGESIAVGALGDLEDPEVNIYKAATAELVTTLTDLLPGGIGVFFADFSADGQYFAASNGVGVGIWETATWSLVAAVEAPSTETYHHVAFSPDGQQLVILDSGGGLLVHDLESGKARALAVETISPASIYSINALEFTDDGRYVVVAGQGFNIVDAATGELIGDQFPSNNLEFGTAIADGGRGAVTATSDHFLVWNLTPEEWPDIACRAAGRNMTPEEWDQFWPDAPYHATCPEWETAG